jgi:hypothetical protein
VGTSAGGKGSPTAYAYGGLRTQNFRLRRRAYEKSPPPSPPPPSCASKSPSGQLVPAPCGLLRRGARLAHRASPSRGPSLHPPCLVTGAPFFGLSTGGAWWEGPPPPPAKAKARARRLAHQPACDGPRASRGCTKTGRGFPGPGLASWHLPQHPHWVGPAGDHARRSFSD